MIRAITRYYAIHNPSPYSNTHRYNPVPENGTDAVVGNFEDEERGRGLKNNPMKENLRLSEYSKPRPEVFETNLGI